MTLGALSLTSEMFARNGAGATFVDCTHIPAPYMFEGLNVIEYMQTLIDDDHSGVEKPAALVMETVQAEGGIRVFDEQFLRDVREFCTKNDIVMIVDDVQVGCCRTGTFFSFERAGIAPDIVVMSKSIGGLGMPLAIVLIKDELDDWKPGEHNGTFRGNQLSFIAKSDNPYCQINSLNGSILSPETSSVLKKRFDKKWAVVVGVGPTLSVYDSKIVILPGLQVTIGRKLFAF